MYVKGSFNYSFILSSTRDLLGDNMYSLIIIDKGFSNEGI